MEYNIRAQLTEGEGRELSVVILGAVQDALAAVGDSHVPTGQAAEYMVDITLGEFRPGDSRATIITSDDMDPTIHVAVNLNSKAWQAHRPLIDEICDSIVSWRDDFDRRSRIDVVFELAARIENLSKYWYDNAEHLPMSAEDRLVADSFMRTLGEVAKVSEPPKKEIGAIARWFRTFAEESAKSVGQQVGPAVKWAVVMVGGKYLGGYDAVKELADAVTQAADP